MSDAATTLLPPPELIAFDSTDWPASERFERYRELYSGGADAIEAGADFAVRLRGWRLERGLLYERHLHHVAHERGAGRVRRDGFTHHTLTLVLAGRYEADAGAGFRVVPPGSAVLLDMRQTMRNRATRAHVVTVGLARDQVRAASGAAGPLHGLILDPPRIDLLADYLRSLARHVADLPGEALGPSVAAMVPLLAIALTGVAGPGGVGLATGDERITQVRRLVDRQCANPDFGPNDIVRLSGLSRATVYRLFKPQGGIASFLLRRRLEIVRIALADPGDRRSFATIAAAAGFVSESHCSRSFRNEFAVRPGEYRAARLALEADPNSGKRLLAWQSEVR